MSKIKNNNFVEGTVISSTDVNDKFTDVATATSAINEENVRNEGIDRKNISDNGITKEWFIHQNNATTGTTYAGQTGASAFAINHNNDLEISFGASGITLSDGDMLRLQYAVRLESNTFTPGPISQRHFILVFPAWDITSNALANYEVFPDHVDMLQVAGAATNYPIEDAGGGTENYTDGYCPSQCWTLGSAGTFYTKRTLHGSLSYIHSGNDQVVYGIRLYGRGPLFLFHDGTYKTWRYTATDNSDITFERGHMLAQVLQKGDV